MKNLHADVFSKGVAALWHLLGSVLVASFAGALVFFVWYPHPYQELAGGRELFLLVTGVDVVTGPLLTLVIFNSRKPRAELIRDVTFVVCIQLGALGYGIWSVWEARPLFLVAEIDRFKVVGTPTLPDGSLSMLKNVRAPTMFQAPIVVAIRLPQDEDERQKILFESLQGGRDYAERPDFYLPYEGAAALKTLVRAKPLPVFLEKYPDQKEAAHKLAREKGVDLSEWLYLPVRGRQDWVAVLDKQAQIQGFLKGDGF